MRRKINRLSLLLSVVLFFLAVIFSYRKDIVARFEHIGGICTTIAGNIFPFISKVAPMLILFFILSIILRLLFNLIKTYYFSKKLKYIKNSPVVIALENKHNLKNKLFTIDHVKPVAFCLGIFQPKIYLSSSLANMMTEQEIEVIILHETYHTKRRDNLFILCAFIIKSTLFFIPVVSDLIDYVMIKKEINADLYGINKLKTDEPVFSAFEKLIQNGHTLNFSYAISFFNLHTLEERIRAIRGKKSITLSVPLTHAVLSFCSFLVLGFVLFYPLKPAQAQSQSIKSIETACLVGHQCHDDCSS